jgi:autotransporter-associated beta strand protein
MATVLASLGTGRQVRAVVLPATADTTIRQDQPTDNFGGYGFVWTGRSDKATTPVRRALFEFDLSSIPVGSTITSASLQLYCTDSHNVASNFRLFRTLVDWGEGTATGKAGATATAGQASWNNRLTGTAAWSTPGGASGTDYSATVSASTSVTGTGAKTWSSAGLLADVQYWVNNPGSNFGWFLISDAEGTNQSVNRFATSENGTTANRPALTVTYTAPSPSVFGVTSGPTPAALRVMKNSTASSAVQVRNTGGTAGDFTITSPTAVTVTPNGQTGVAANATVNLAVRWSDVANTGARSGSFKVHNASNAADTDDTVNLTGAVLDNRSITAPTLDFGRFANGSTASTSRSATLATSGDSDHFTSVTVRAAAVAANADGVGATAAAGDVVFNAAAVTMARNITLNKALATAGQVNGSLAMTVQGEGLTGESAAATIPYTYRVVDKRTVSGPTGTLNLGRVHVNGTANAPVAFTSTTGDDNSFTRVSIANQASGGLTLSGTPMVFDGSAGSNARTVSLAAGATAGTASSTANFVITPEGIGDTGYPTVDVPYTASVYSGQGVWNVDGSGTWSDPAKWTALGGVPGMDGTLSANDTATLGTVLAAGPATVSLQAASPRLSSLTLNNASKSFAIDQGGGAGVLHLNGTAGATVTVAAGSHAISAPLALDSNVTVSAAAGAALTVSGPVTGTAGAGLVKAGSGALVLSAANAYTGGTNVSAGTLRVSHADALPAATDLTIAGAGSRTILTAGLADAIKLNALTIDARSANPVAALDLTNDKLIVNKTAMPLSVILSQIKAAYAGGAWTGNGITSSTAAADFVANSAGYGAIGYADNADFGMGLTSFGGRAVDGNAILVRYTVLGDANLDGRVDGTDYSLLQRSYGKTSGAFWDQGDFNYDGKVDLRDALILRAHYSQVLAQPAFSRTAANPLQTVPEPASVALLAAGALLGAAGFWLRRRSSSARRRHA